MLLGAALAALGDGERTAEDVREARDGDLTLRLRATVCGDAITLDFTGSAGQDPGNLNCPRAVTYSACVFAVRVLTDPDVPPSAGAHRPVTGVTEPGTLLDARYPAAVAAATSRRPPGWPTWCCAFGCALGQGTMNNLTLGNPGFSYYETLGGGQRAADGAPGPSGVHVAMSNTRNTPVEALELELPVRIVEYAIRRGSGGTGRRPARRAAAPGRAGATSSRERRCPERPPGSSPRARSCGSRRRAAGVSGRLSHHPRSLRRWPEPPTPTCRPTWSRVRSRAGCGWRAACSAAWCPSWCWAACCSAWASPARRPS